MTNQEALDLFEDSLKRLKTFYDLFFAGARKLPPTEERRRLDAMVHELAKAHIRDNGMRFRYNTLLSRYNQFRELWSRKMRELEEGPTDFRKRNAIMSKAPDPQKTVEAPLPGTRSVTSEDPESYVKVGGAMSNAAMVEIFTRISEANRKLGKNGGLSLEQVTEMVAKQAEQLRSRYNVSTIAFRVDTVEGKIKLKAKPVQE